MPQEQNPQTLSPEAVSKIQKAASHLSNLAPELVDQDPYFALAALTLAAATVGAILKVDYKDLVKLVSDHYENALLQEIDAQLKEKGSALLKPQGGPQ